MQKILITLCLLILSIESMAQSSASVTWGLNSGTAVTSTSGNISGSTETFSNMTVNSYATVTGSGSGASQLSTITGGSWPAESQQNNSRYVQFSVNAVSGYTFNVTSVTLYYGGKGGGNVKGNIAYSTDETFSSSTRLNATTLTISSSAGTMSSLSYTLNSTITTGQNFLLRVFPWYTSASSGKYLCLQNVVISGTTSAINLATISTTEISLVQSTTASSGGNISSAGGGVISARGVCWKSSSGPTISDSCTNDGTGTGSFTSQISGLTPGMTYYVRAYATNAAGTSYGEERSFTTTTSVTLPAVTTSAINSITLNSAIGGGNITSDGGGTITSSGVCWNTSGNPTVANDTTNTAISLGSFSSQMSGLNSSTIYYVRAYATNSAGTGYGDQVSFTTVGNFYNVASSDISLITNWGTNTDGSGSHPDFSKDNQNYYFTNPGNVFSQNWIISANSKLIIGNGTDSINFTIPSLYYLNGNVDIRANAVITIQNSNNLKLGTLNSSSSVIYDGSDSIQIISGNYGNIFSSNDAGGKRTMPAGNISVSGSFNSGSAVWSPPVAGIFIYNGNSQQTIQPITYYNLQLNNSAGAKIDGIVTINSGGLLTVSSGTLTVNGTLDNLSSLTPVLSGSLNVKNGGYYKVNGGPIPSAAYDAGSTVEVVSGNPGLIANIGGNLLWNSTGQPGISLTLNTIGGNFIVNNGTFSHGTGGVARTVSVGGNMYINGGVYSVAGYSSSSATIQTLTIAGNLIISGGSLYPSNNGIAGANGTVNIGGNLVHTGGVIGNGPNVTTNLTGKIVFNGALPQTIQTTGLTNKLNLVVNNAAGVSLGSNLTIDAGLILTNGYIGLGSYNLTMNEGSSITGNLSENGMILVNGSGEFRKVFSTAGSFTFPIGDISGTSEFAPVTVNVTASAYSTAFVSVKTTRAKHPQNTSLTDYLKRYWTITSSGFTGPVFSASFTYNAADVNGTESNIYGARYYSSTWENAGVINTGTHTFSTPTFSGSGDFSGVDGSVVTPQPILTVTSTGIAFGRVARNTTSTERTYAISGHSLSPAEGNIEVTAPSGFTVSTTSGSGFAGTLNIPYTGGVVTSTTIYVRFSPTAAQPYSGVLSNSGGGAVTQNINVTGTGIIPNSELGVNMIIAADGTGDYTTWQAAINAIPVSHPGISPYIIYVRPGFYHEKVTIPATLSDIKFIGEDKATTILDYNDYVGNSGTPNIPGTNAVQSLQINSSSTTFENLTIQNLVTVERAVAINIGNSADKISFYNCDILGHQDTYYFYNCFRVYHKNCKISGSVDFIFGNGTAVFDSCLLSINRNGGVVTAASTTSNLLYGLVFRKCTMVADSLGFDSVPITNFYLGRPWNNNPKTVFLYCQEPSQLNSGGWTLMNSDPMASVNQNTLYAEFQCTGAGFNPGGRATISGNINYGRQLSESEAETYTLQNIFAASSKTDSPFPNGDWSPTGSENVLPVELTSFTAENSAKGVIIRWKTANEIQNMGWDVERRESRGENLNNWMKIAFVSGAKNSNSPKEYQYIDNSNLFGEYEYRLKQIDIDGTTSYVNKIRIKAGNKPTDFAINNYPNPFNPVTKIRYEIPEISKIKLTVFNLLGEKISELVDDIVEPGIFQVDFDASALTSGIYFYTLQTDKILITKKMLLVK